MVKNHEITPTNLPADIFVLKQDPIQIEEHSAN